MAPMPYGMWPAYAGVPIWSDNGLLVGPGAYPVSLVAPMGPVMWPPHVLVSPRHAMGGQHQHGKNGGGRARGGRSRGGHARSHSNASSSVHDSISSLGEANASSPQSARGGDGASSAAGSTRGAAGKAAAAAAASAAGSPGGAASTSSEAGSGALSRTASGSTAVPSSDRQGWAWLVEGVLEKVVARLARGGCSATGVQSFRLTCRHWRRVADGAIDSLSPGALRPKELVTLFPRLQVGYGVGCLRVGCRSACCVLKRTAHWYMPCTQLAAATGVAGVCTTHTHAHPSADMLPALRSWTPPYFSYRRCWS